MLAILVMLIGKCCSRANLRPTAMAFMLVMLVMLVVLVVFLSDAEDSRVAV